MYYHASPTAGIAVLEPRISKHGTPLVYFSEKRENVLVYLSNAVEKYCRETGFAHDGPWQKWGPYGFTKEGLLYLEEYYPDALRETYAGVGGYVYNVEHLPKGRPLRDIPFAFVSETPVAVSVSEFVPDAYEALLQAEAKGQLLLRRYAQLSPATHQWLRSIIPAEYAEAEEHPEYRHFLRAKFSDILA